MATDSKETSDGNFGCDPAHPPILPPPDVITEIKWSKTRKFDLMNCHGMGGPGTTTLRNMLYDLSGELEKLQQRQERSPQAGQEGRDRGRPKIPTHLRYFDACICAIAHYQEMQGVIDALYDMHMDCYVEAKSGPNFKKAKDCVDGVISWAEGGPPPAADKPQRE